MEGHLFSQLAAEPVAANQEAQLSEKVAQRFHSRPPTRLATLGQWRRSSTQTATTLHPAASGLQGSACNNVRGGWFPSFSTLLLPIPVKAVAAALDKASLLQPSAPHRKAV